MNGPAFSGSAALADALMRVPIHLDLGREDHRREFSELASSVAPLARSGAVDMAAYMDGFLARVEGTQSDDAENILRDALMSPAPVVEDFLPDDLEVDPTDDVPPPASEADYGLPAADAAEAVDTVVEPMDTVDVATLAGLPPEREWLIRDRLPMGNLNMLSGDGAAGKTTIALQLAVAVVLEDCWLGERIEKPGPVIFLTAEEDLNEVWRRLHAILENRSMTLPDLAGRGFYLICLDQEDARVWAAGPGGTVTATFLFRRLEALVRDLRPSLVIAEALADLSGVNENVRAEVVQGLRPARILARQTGTCILFIAHPSRAGKADGSGESGSTHWRNTVRAWLNFTVDPDDKNVRLLASTKTNYSGLNSEPKRLKWSSGEYVPVSLPTSVQRAAADAQVDEAFLRCLNLRSSLGFDDGPNPGKNYAPTIYADMPEAKGATSKALAIAMMRLIEARAIIIIKRGPKSRQKSVLTVAERTVSE